jgi:hypothetical protein
VSQWRGYGRGEAPAELGLDLLLQSRNLPPRTLVRKVVYEEDEQQQLVDTANKSFIETTQVRLSSGRSVSELFRYPATWALEGLCARLLRVQQFIPS